MNRVATRMLWSVCCIWALSGCEASDGTTPESIGDILADVASADGTDAAPQDVGASEVLVTADGLGDGEPLDDTVTSDDVVAAEDSAPAEDSVSAPDAVPTEDTAPEEDSASPQDVSPPAGCQEPNPAGCTQTLCEEDEICDPSQGCNPSSCFCNETIGDWDCSKDCGGGVCVPKLVEETACAGPNPAGCILTGCPDAYSCVSDPLICVPSTCTCDEAASTWSCSNDCEGGLCKKDEESPCSEPDPTSCSVIGCDLGFLCDLDVEECAPSNCTCDEASGGWVCTNDCLPGQCVPDKPVTGCLKPDPTSCSVIGCQEGFLCDLEAAGCGPSSCTCDEVTGGWVCTKDCLPGQCVPNKPVTGCLKPDPTSCSVVGCEDGLVCDLDPAVCGPSSCMCNEATGTWLCTNDCLPGKCVPAEVLCSEDEFKTPTGCMSCDEVLAFVTADVQENINNAGANCETDEECVMTTALSDCLVMCPAAVKSMWAGKFVAKIQLVSDAYCQGYEEKCGLPTPMCVPSEAACVDGACQSVPIP